MPARHAPRPQRPDSASWQLGGRVRKPPETAKNRRVRQARCAASSWFFLDRPMSIILY